MNHYAMKRMPPSVQMQQPLTEQLHAGSQGHPLRQFVAHAAELLLQIGLAEQVDSFLKRRDYGRGTTARGARRTQGTSQREQAG